MQVAKLAVEAPVHKIEVRRARCFKDSVAVFAGKGHAVWRQPLKVCNCVLMCEVSGARVPAYGCGCGCGCIAACHW